jgi:type IV conjugative transfer system protein TraE
MSLFFAGLRFNLTPDNIDAARDILLRYVDPKYYEAFKMEMVNEGDHMKKEHITTAFFPVDVRVDARHLTAVIIGDLVSTVGTNRLPNKRLSYQIRYGYHNAKFLVESFIEVKPHD